MTDLSSLPLRENLRGLSPYGAPQLDVPYMLNTNENTHPVPQEVADDILDAVAIALRDVNRYPDREFTELREGFADYLGYGLTREQIWAANGSNEVLQHVLQAFGGPGRTAFGFAPTYSMYPLITRATGATWTAGTRAADFSVDAESAASEDPGRRVRMTYFEVVAALAFAAFADSPVDVAVVEVGLGGVWDATSVADGVVAVVTPISLDHTRLLGSTLEEIATEKAGIIKPGSIAVVGVRVRSRRRARRRPVVLAGVEDAALDTEPVVVSPAAHAA